MTSAQPVTTTPSKSQPSTAASEGVQQKGTGTESLQGLFIQPKLSIGAIDDPLEKEADSMADNVMRMPTPEPLHFSPAGNMINRKCAHCEEEENKVQRKESKSESASTAPSIVHDVLNSSGSRHLDSGIRSFMEPRFHYDFSNVKIHDNDLAAKSASSINALAYTSGNNIVFNSGQYNTNTDPGKRLLAHELTHVVQQGNAPHTIQRKPSLTKDDIDDIANKVHKAIAGLGTDEEGVYRALQRLEKDPGAIAELQKVYLTVYKVSLEEDIRDDFSDEELQYALELIGIGPQVQEELIGSVPSSESEYEFAAGKLYAAMKGIGTNEEAIYGALIAMENVPERIARLKAAYSKKYPTGLHGGDLEYDIRDEMSGDELDYALLLLNVFPLGNTAILAWIRKFIGAKVKDETAKEVMQSLDQVTNDRLRVIIIDIIRAGELDKFRNNLVSVVASDFKGLVYRIRSIETEFNAPGAASTAATADQKTRIGGILDQGMTIDPGTGHIAAFADIVDGRSFEMDIKETIEREITEITPESVARLALPRFDWPQYEVIANEARERTDAVFGHYGKGSALTSTPGPDRNLFDFSAQAFADTILLQFANYLVTAHRPRKPVYPGKKIKEVHNVDLDRPVEKGILTTAVLDWFNIPGNKARIQTVMSAWQGAHTKDDAGNGTIFLQRWNAGDVDKNRYQFWSTFQTMIHEYLHKVTNKHYSDKAREKGRIKEQVYTEGGTAYFDQRVWKTLYPEEIRANKDLRRKVEGAEYEYNSSLVPKRSGYADQAAQFTQIVQNVGEDNAAAAYFQGKTDRVGLDP